MGARDWWTPTRGLGQPSPTVADRPTFGRITHGAEATFRRDIANIVGQAQAFGENHSPLADTLVHDTWKGPAYGIASDEQRRFLADVARCSGLILDPVYSGKALFGLAMMPSRPRRALFIHTGGLPGLLAEHASMVLSPEG